MGQVLICYLTQPLSGSMDLADGRTGRNNGRDGDVIRQNEAAITSISSNFLPESASSTKASPRARNLASSPLPEYIAPAPTSLDIEDADFLSRKGALTVPKPELRDALIRSYIEFVHPLMPVLDLKEFLACIGSGTGQVSLLLLQAVLFAGTSFVDIKQLRMLGFLTRKAARRAFFEKVKVRKFSQVGSLRTKADVWKLLYDFEYEKDRLRVIQTLFLMTLWYETPDDQKDGWHWLGIALSLGRTIGLNRNPSSSMPIEEQHLRKRIWWTCFMRDPVAALGVKRPVRILPGDHNVQELLLADLEIASSPTGLPGICDDGRLAWDTDKQHRLATLCIEMTKLCQCLSHILSERYAMTEGTQGRLSHDRTVTSMVLLPITEAGSMETFKRCEDELSSWRETLPEDAVYVRMAQEAPSSIDGCLVVNRATLNMLYQATRMTLYRPLMRTHAMSVSAADDGPSICPPDTARKAVRSAAAEITKIALDLHQLDIVRFLPQTGLSVLVSATMSHISDMESPSETVRNEGLQGFDICWQAIQELRDGYFSADFSSQFVELVVRWTKLRVSQRLGVGPGLSFSPVHSDEQLLARQGESLEMASPPEVEQPKPIEQLTTHAQMLPDASTGSIQMSDTEGSGHANPAWLQAKTFSSGDETWSYFEIENMQDAASRLLGGFGANDTSPFNFGLDNESPGFSNFLQNL